MIRQAAIDYSKLIDVNLTEKLKPINQTIDDMLTRLEECEAMVAMVQQERCNSIGLTGSLSQTVDHRQELKTLCTKIDALETFVEHVKSNVDTLESKLDEAERHFGVTDNTTKLKNFFAPMFQKKTESGTTSEQCSSREIFKTEDYFEPLEEPSE